jgi:methylmalonyl-CoA/ethylmalonyl-CoA epimerase
MNLPDPAASGATGMDHVGIVVADLGSAAERLGLSLHGTLIAGGLEVSNNVRSAIYAFPGGGKFEILQPVGPGGMADFLERNGEGVHHITFLVPDVTDAVARAESFGALTTGADLSDPVWHETYLRPRHAHGCLVQLVTPSDRYGAPVEGITLEDVLADRWLWVDRQPTRAE